MNMRDHDWERLILDGGHLGAYESWDCRRCGATNMSLSRKPGPDQFYACGCGPNVTALPADCDAAHAWITEHRKTCPHHKEAD
jgi:hypothetical protein